MSLQSWTCKDCINTEMRITPNGEIAEYCKFTDDYGHTNRTEWHGDLVTCLDKQTKHDEVIKCHDQYETRNMMYQLDKDGYEYKVDNCVITVFGGIRYE